MIQKCTTNSQRNIRSDEGLSTTKVSPYILKKTSSDLVVPQRPSVYGNEGPDYFEVLLPGVAK